MEKEMKQYRYYIVDGEVYDLTDFIPKHPGGPLWFTRSNGRDLSAAVHVYHRDPSKLYPILKKYKVESLERSKELDPSFNIPPHLLPENCNANLHTPIFKWKEDDLLSTLKKSLNTPHYRSKIWWANFWFDVCAVTIFLTHVFMSFAGMYYKLMPDWALVCFFVFTRTAMCGVGHYHCHRKKNGVDDWADCFLDMQYVGSFVDFDGHVMLHHFYTATPGDVKRTFFRGLLAMPRLFRIPAMTLARFLMYLSGIPLRVLCLFDPHGIIPLKFIEYLGMRILLFTEFVFACYCGMFHVWAIQFFLTVWWNMFVIVSSHEFENQTDPDTSIPIEDWAIYQIKNCIDMVVVGNAYLDCFLTGGLGPHRVHHVVPAQQSGFANVVCEELFAKASKDFGVDWGTPQNFLLERLPVLMKYYFGTPASYYKENPDHGLLANLLLEACSPTGWKNMIGSVFVGFTGMGSV